MISIDSKTHRSRKEATLLKIRHLVFGIACCTLVPSANAGADVADLVQAVQIAADGKLWFALKTSTAATYCKPGWGGLNMYIPREHADYPYYYGMLMMALSKGKTVYIANISVYNGTGPCDITQTGYGMYTY